MLKTRLIAIALLIAGVGIGYFNYNSEVSPDSKFQFRLGLDLSGGSHLVYRADVSGLPVSEVRNSMDALRDVIERRVNMFGVSEPIVQVEQTLGIASDGVQQRLIVELPGVTDIDAAIALIGQTPLLEFKVERPNGETQAIFQAWQNEERLDEDPYLDSGLTGRYLDRAKLEFGGGNGSGLSNEPIVAIDFNAEGADLFAQITRENLGKTVAIYLDGAIISAPVVQSEILGGSAIISGNFDPEEAKQLVGRLNSGALPVPITLLSTQTIGPSLGQETLFAGVKAGIYGLVAVALFLIFWYRLPGLLAVIALAIYLAIMLAIFKLIPVTLTAAGIAGFILSVGMAVDANILIFERIKEELRKSHEGKAFGDGLAETPMLDAMKIGFDRAWLSIRDGNISSIITAVILFWFGTSLVKGFALTFGLGVLVSMLSAITVTRTFLYAVAARENSGIAKVLFGTGLK